MLGLLVATLAFAAPPGESGPCAGAKAQAIIAGSVEPGQRMEVRGQVTKADGTGPAAGVVMYVYHTDASGVYGKDARGGPRLRAWLRTDSDGRYEYKTIRPARYPDGRIPAHVHLQFWGNGVPPQWNEDFELDGPKRVKTEEKDGVVHVRMDYRLKGAGDRFDESILHGLGECGARPAH